MDLSVFAADVGSIARDRFGWAGQLARGERPEGSNIDELWQRVADSLKPGAHVALGFECPLFVPLASEAPLLGRAREGEGSRSWSAGAGCGALASGLVQLTYVLTHIRARLPDVRAYLSWSQFAQSTGGLLIWEAFVSGKSKATSHIGDARRAVDAFTHVVGHVSQPRSAVSAADSFSLAGAALLRAGWDLPLSVLAESCLVVSG